MAASNIKSGALVKDVMVQPVFTITPGMKLWEVAELFISHRISGSAVIDPNGRVLTVMGEGITLRLAASEGLEATVASCLDKMTPADKIVIVRPEDPFTEAYRLIIKHNIHRIPAVDSAGHLKGIVSRSMILKIFVEAHYGKKLA